MDITNLITIISLIFGISVATERVVEIIKGLIPWLNEKKTSVSEEGWRTATIQTLAMLVGIATTWMVNPVIPSFIPQDWMGKIGIGLLASGGSGFWNSIISYILAVKDIKSAEAKDIL